MSVDIVEKLQEKEQPRLLIGSPPCKDFSALLYLTKTREEIEQRKEEEGIPRHNNNEILWKKKEERRNKHIINNQEGIINSKNDKE